jgi:hypothetical protein
LIGGVDLGGSATVGFGVDAAAMAIGAGEGVTSCCAIAGVGVAF